MPKIPKKILLLPSIFIVIITCYFIMKYKWFKARPTIFQNNFDINLGTYLTNNLNLVKNYIDSDGVQTSIITPDSTYLFTASLSGTLRQWNLKTKKLARKTINAHSGPILTMAVTPDNKNLFTGGRDGHLKQWEIDPELKFVKDYGIIPLNYLKYPCMKYKDCHKEIVPDWVSGMAITSNGKILITSGYKNMHHWDIPGQYLIRTIKDIH